MIYRRRIPRELPALACLPRWQHRIRSAGVFARDAASFATVFREMLRRREDNDALNCTSVPTEMTDRFLTSFFFRRLVFWI